MDKLQSREYALKSAIRELTEQLRRHLEAHGEHYKTCTKCQEIQPLTEYYSRANGNLKPECKTCLKIRAREYDQTEPGRKAQRTGRKNLRAKSDFPERQNAWARISELVRMGRIPPAKHLSCSHRGGPADHYHHHKGYTREYREDVIPLCVQCHADEHFST